MRYQDKYENIYANIIKNNEKVSRHYAKFTNLLSQISHPGKVVEETNILGLILYIYAKKAVLWGA